MNIRLRDWKVINIKFSLSDDEIEGDVGKFDLETGKLFPEDVSKTFGVVFKLIIKEKAIDLFVEAVFNFELEESITEEFKLSSFPNINAPAIAFPYLRAFISNLTLQSGINPVILPSINFIKLSEEKKESTK
jgi:preprotein translocase subunit SecB